MKGRKRNKYTKGDFFLIKRKISMGIGNIEMRSKGGERGGIGEDKARSALMGGGKEGRLVIGRRGVHRRRGRGGRRFRRRKKSKFIIEMIQMLNKLQFIRLVGLLEGRPIRRGKDEREGMNIHNKDIRMLAGEWLCSRRQYLGFPQFVRSIGA